MCGALGRVAWLHHDRQLVLRAGQRQTQPLLAGQHGALRQIVEQLDQVGLGQPAHHGH